MRVLVCTGGMGSGKSYIVRLCNALGIPSYDSDSAAKSLYDKDINLVSKLASAIGKDILDGTKLNKEVFARKIFSDPYLLEIAESIIHPAVFADFLFWKMNCKPNKYDIVIFESAIFLEKEFFKPIADKVLVVCAPLELRIDRIKKRDHLSDEQILLRINNQWDDQKRIAMADFTIFADETQALLPRVLKILSEV